MITGFLLAMAVGVSIGGYGAAKGLPWWTYGICAGAIGGAISLICTHVGLP